MQSHDDDKHQATVNTHILFLPSSPVK